MEPSKGNPVKGTQVPFKSLLAKRIPEMEPRFPLNPSSQRESRKWNPVKGTQIPFKSLLVKRIRRGVTTYIF
jgi:hypothetical protein